MANEEQGFMSPEEQSAASAFALELIKDYRDRGCPPLKPIPAEGIATDDELGRVRAD
jgi:4-hydroxyacetophenone monooxygenase